MKSLFLSHCHADKKFVRKLAEDLHDHDVYIWIDEAEIKLGDSLLQKISEGINRVDYVGVVLSSASIRSKWVQKEVEIAMNQEIEGRRVKVLPILIEDCELPSFLSGKLYADFRKGYSGGLASLLSRLETQEFFGPHQPIVRSHEISVSAESLDQVPRVVRRGDHLLIQWVEHKEEVDVVYIYVLDIMRFQFLDYYFYTIPSEIYAHWLIVSDGTVGSFAQLEYNRELWYADATNPRQLDPVKIDWKPQLVDSIIPTSGGFIVSTSFGKQVELVKLSKAGLVKKKHRNRVHNWTTFTSLVRLSKGIGMFSNTLKGIEFSIVNKDYEIQSPQTIIAADATIKSVAHLNVRFYDNSTWADGGELFLLYHQRSETGQQINLCTISNKGRLTKLTTVISNTEKQVHILKPSLGIGATSVLVLWNVMQTLSIPAHAHEKMLLSCMLFDRQTLKPLLPYDRTLTAGSNCSSGIPAIVNRDTYYIVYQEDLLERFNIKVSEITLSELRK